MDPREEQEQELEALQSIYIDDELEILSRNPLKFSIKVKSSTECSSATLKLTIPPEYPNEVPEIGVSGTFGLSSANVADLVLKLKSEATDSLGMAMIFTLCSITQEFLDDLKGITAPDADEPDTVEEEKEAEYVLSGTPVAVESFNAWKAAFEEEMREKDAALTKAQEKFLALPTGKQLFERDRSAFTEEG